MNEQTPQERAIDGILEYAAPNPDFGWEGIPALQDRDVAMEMLIFLWDEFGIDVTRWSAGRKP